MKSAKKAVKKAAAKRKAAAAKKRARKAAVAPFSSTGGGRVVRMRKLGPIAEAEFRLRPLTVFVGPNGTGKTFACKALYSFFRAMEDNHVEAAFRRALEGVAESLTRARNHEPRPGEDIRKILRAISSAEEKMGKFRVELARLPGGNFRAQIEKADQTRPLLDEMCEEIHRTFKQATSVVRMEAPALRGEMRMLNFSLCKILNACQMNGRELVAEGMRASLMERLVLNFQAALQPPKEFRIPGLPMTEIRGLEVAGCGSFTRDGDDGSFELPPDRELRQPEFSPVVFLDSPVYWKLRNPLEDRRFSRSFTGARQLDDVPQYFDDLASLLRKKFLSPVIRGVCARLEEVVDGKIVMAETGELLFREKGGMRSMHNTAGGKVNLGMLSFLIERGIIVKNALVFIDEPEAYLHPAWQEEMAEALACLVNGGVHVVVATQSDWMLSTIANIVRRGELGENGKAAALTREQVGVWLFEREKNGGGSAAREMMFDNISGYIPDHLRALSNALHNETADLLDEMDDRGMLNVAEGGGK